MIKSILAIFYFVFLCTGCAYLPLRHSSLTPQTQLKIEQATFLSPNEADWFLMSSDMHTLIFSKKVSDPSYTQIISVLNYPVVRDDRTVISPAKEFLKFISEKREANDDKARFKILSNKLDYVTYRKLPCLKYETVSEDHQDKGIKSADFLYYKTNGYICRYPLEYLALQIEASERSHSNEFSPKLLDLTKQFLTDMQLVEPTIERLKTIK